MSLIERIRKLFEPRENREFILLLVLLSLITYVHASLRGTKSVLVISHLGTELISAIKLYAIVPLTIVFMLGYIKLTDFVRRVTLAHILTWSFISWFVLFALVIYPNLNDLNWHWIATTKLGQLPSLRYLTTVLVNWHLSLYYFLSEMWVTVMFSITAWQIINQISSQENAKKFYPWYGCISSFGSMTGGYMLKLLAQNFTWEIGLRWLVSSFIVVALLISLVLTVISRLARDKNLNTVQQYKQKRKAGLWNSLKVIASSRVIRLITLLLLCFNITINLIEGVWNKSYENFFQQNALKIQALTGEVQFYTSLCAIIFALVSYHLLKRFSWRATALFCPMIFLIGGGIFFGCIVSKEHLTIGLITMSALQMAIYIGAVHNVFAHSSKRSMFDATKEMAYLPLDDALRSKGKAAAELIGMRFGKGAGALIQQFLLLLPFTANNLVDLAPITGSIYMILTVIWIYAVFSLAKYLRMNNHT